MLNAFVRRRFALEPTFHMQLHFKRYLCQSEPLPSVSENPVAAGVSRRKYRHRVLRSLNPSAAAFTRQKTFDISNATRLRFRQTDEGIVHVYPQNVKGCNAFPENTRGVLYYHVDTSLPPLAGEVRFRLCDTVGDFDRGSDFQMLNFPWTVSLPRIALAEDFAPLRRMLLKEGLVDAKIMSDLSRRSIRPSDRSMLFHIGQPFIIDLAEHWLRMNLVTTESTTTVKFSNMFTDRRIPDQAVLYTGVLRARWEFSKLPQHKRLGPTLVLRILDVITEIKSLAPGRLVQPEPGQLLQRTATRRPKVWAYPLNKRVNGPVLKRFITATKGLQL